MRNTSAVIRINKQLDQGGSFSSSFVLVQGINSFRNLGPSNSGKPGQEKEIRKFEAHVCAT